MCIILPECSILLIAHNADANLQSFATIRISGSMRIVEFERIGRRILISIDNTIS